MRSVHYFSILIMILVTFALSAYAKPWMALPADHVINGMIGGIGLTDSRGASSPTGQDTIPSLPEKLHLPAIEQAPNSKDCLFEVDARLAKYPNLETRLGCPVSAASYADVAINEFGAGPDFNRFMLWFAANSEIDVLFPDGNWQGYADTWKEVDGEIACNPPGETPSSPPLPRRGFGKIWCSHEDVQKSMGTIEVEERLCEEAIVQRFELGRLIACSEDIAPRFFRLLTSGGWDVEAIVSDGLYSTTTIWPASANGARFAVIGDFGAGTQPEADVARLVKSWSPDFIVTVGDNNYPNGASSTIDRNIGQYYHEYIHPYVGAYGPTGPVADDADDAVNRFFPTMGNHDWYTVKCDGDVCSGAHFDYFTLPGNERYYDFVQGPVHFFVVDSDKGEPDGISSTSVQAAWLRDGLAASTEAWNVVLLHHAPYSSFRHGPSEGLQWPFREWGAHVVLAGHDHSYERLLIDGVLYFVNGLGGASRYQVGDPIPGSQVRYNLDFGAMLVEAGEQEMAFRFISVAGEIIDSVVLLR